MIVIVQARMGSSRLPGKVMFDLGGVTVLERILNTAIASNVGPVVLALPDTAQNDALADGISGPVTIRRGPEHDVAQRFRPVVEEHGDGFVRICADSPFIDAFTIRNTVDSLRASDAAYCIGGDAGRRAQAVRAAPWLAALPRMTAEEREHVIPAWFGPKIEAAPLTLDTMDDYQRLKEIA